ncbi:MAG: oligosaccharide flippase family protein, partial [Candidatus Dormibacteraeota bacterium]|nr:oligosaccharide flippase family protein [Candidatus Dormibacteraeota bacterium]
LGALLLIATRGPLAEIALGSASRGSDVLILAPALLLGVAAGVQLALLTGHHRVRQVVAVNIGTAVAAAGFGVVIVATNGEAGLSSALLVTAGVQLALSWVARRRATRTMGNGARDLTAAAAQDLLRVGLPVAGSQLASGGAMLVAPLLVLQQLGTVEVGYYRAATAISVGYLTFFLAALTQDYLPRISAASDGADMAALVERRMRLVLGLGMPLILGLLAAGPVLVELLYTSDFAPAFSVLQWQLVGDLLRLPAWVLAFVLVARKSSSAYFGAELISGLTLIGGTLVGLALVGLSGAGVGYAVSQGLYYLVVWLLVRGRVPTVPGRLQALVLVAATASSIVLIAELSTLQRSALFGAAALVLAALAWPRIYRLHRTGEL